MSWRGRRILALVTPVKNIELSACLRSTVLVVGYTFLLLAAGVQHATAQHNAAAGAHQFSFKLPVAGKEVGCCPTIGMPANDTGGKRLPSLIGIGVEKCGSTYLSDLLMAHPKMQMSRQKEVHFLDTNIDKEKLPTALKQYLNVWKINRDNEGQAAPDIQLFEVTPNYIYIPSAACRSKTFFPNAKFVVVLRDPADRAYSQFTMFRSVQCPFYKRAFICPYENTRFFDVVQQGIALLGIRNCTFNTGQPLKAWNDCFGCLINDESVSQYCHGRWYMFNNGPHNQRCHELAPDILSRGLYAPQIAWWFQHISPDRFLFINSKELFKDPVGEMNRVADFSGLDTPFTAEMFSRRTERKNTGFYGKFNDKLVEDTKVILRDFYRRPNEDLYELLRINGHNFTRFDDANGDSTGSEEATSEGVPEIPEQSDNRTDTEEDVIEDVGSSGATIADEAPVDRPETADNAPGDETEAAENEPEPNLRDIADLFM